MVLIDMIATQALPIGVFTLDTGRLPGETYALIDRVRSHYGLPIDVYYPNASTLEAYVRANGVNAFYNSIELRQRCCTIRKTEPLRRALEGAGAWLTGLRRSQSATRNDVPVEAYDVERNLLKVNPLAEWNDEDVWGYILTNGVPYNPLHDSGFPSIGCAPCTRAVKPGEDVRAGRWWWERTEQKECGLHRRPLDVLVRVEAAGAQL
jgi:phosphoadenosine phosphosulfate reductase